MNQGQDCPPHGARNCFSCQGRPLTEWAVLDDDSLRLLEQSRISNTYQAGQTIFYQGNPCLGLHCIESGEIALRKSDAQGRSVIVRLVHGGQTTGYRAFFSGEPYTASAEALTESRVCFIDRDAVRRLLAVDPRLGHAFLSRATTELREAEESRLQDAWMSVRMRLAHLLLTLKDRCGRVGEGGVLSIELPMSRQDLASLLGTRPETIARAIRALTEAGVARFEGRVVHVDDLDLLLDELEPTDEVVSG